MARSGRTGGAFRGQGQESDPNEEKKGGPFHRRQRR